MLYPSIYRTFWKRSDACLDRANHHDKLYTVLGWQIRVGCDASPASIRNFLTHADGAEILQLACPCHRTAHRCLRVVHYTLLILCAAHVDAWSLAPSTWYSAPPAALRALYGPPGTLYGVFTRSAEYPVLSRIY